MRMLSLPLNSNGQSRFGQEHKREKTIFIYSVITKSTGIFFFKDNFNTLF